MEAPVRDYGRLRPVTRLSHSSVSVSSALAAPLGGGESRRELQDISGALTCATHRLLIFKAVPRRATYLACTRPLCAALPDS